ncbi:MAG TPA: hypothetical protein VGD14_03990 [bacterium]
MCIDCSRRNREIAFSTLTNGSNPEKFELEQIEAGLNPEEETINIDIKNRILDAIQKLPEIPSKYPIIIYCKFR